MKKALLLLVLTAIVFATVCGTVFAATAQDIYNDYAEDGDLDGVYTETELRAYLNNATLHQYPPDSGKVRSLDSLVRGLLAARDRFPFTGTQIALVAAGVVVLLAVGIGLRRLSRARS